jgi:hypothetical protein
MGDMAEYYMDLSMMSQWEDDEKILDMLKLDNNTLIKNTEISENSLIIGICTYYEKYKKLSDKQRWCLSKWLVDNDEHIEI